MFLIAHHRRDISLLFLSIIRHDRTKVLMHVRSTLDMQHIEGSSHHDGSGTFLIALD